VQYAGEKSRRSGRGREGMMAGRTSVDMATIPPRLVFPRTSRPGDPAGFTLVELMVTIAILALVAGVVAAAFSGGLSVWDAAQNFDRPRMEALIAIETFEREIRSSIPFYAIAFSGDGEGLKFCRIVGGKTHSDMPGTIEEIGYRFDREAKTVCRSSREFPWTGMATPGVETVLHDVLEFHVYYADRVEEGHVNLEWKGWWKPHRERLPAAVAVQVVLAQRGGTVKISRTIYLPRRARTNEDAADNNA
jgi:prepilin-type N-terminal cleavage/methylation domain-containing protein